MLRTANIKDHKGISEQWLPPPADLQEAIPEVAQEVVIQEQINSEATWEPATTTQEQHKVLMDFLQVLKDQLSIPKDHQLNNQAQARPLISKNLTPY